MISEIPGLKAPANGSGCTACYSIENVAGERHVWNFAVGQPSSPVGIAPE
jgi:hypothetical protein